MIKRTLIAVGILLSISILLQLLLVFYAVYNQHHWVGYVALTLLVFPVLWLISSGASYIARHRVLNIRGFKLSSRASHAELKTYLKYLIGCIKRIASHQVLSEAQASGIHQQANDLEDALGHHPLNDDLIRGIALAREDIIGPAFGVLNGIGVQITASKARAVVQDIYQPPFPVISPLVVAYHQFTLVSEITDLYLSRPSMSEYYCVQRDVWQIMTKGDFLRYGQRLFAGINTNTHRLGRSAEDLGQVFSIVWLTHAFSQAATMRCCTLHDWNLNDAISDMRHQMLPCLEKTRDSLINDAMPIIKKRMRTYAPIDRDPELFINDIAANFTKAVDSVLQALTISFRDNESAAETSPGLVISQHTDNDNAFANQSETIAHINAPVRVKKHRRRRRSNRPKGGFLKQLMYIIKRPK